MSKLRKALLIVPLMLEAHWSVGQDGIVPAGRENLVSLTAMQLGEQHCQNYPDAFSVSLRLLIRLRNESSERVIVSKRLNPPFRVTVSTSLEELNQGHFVYSRSILEVTNENPKLENSVTARIPSVSLFWTQERNLRLKCGLPWLRI